MTTWTTFETIDESPNCDKFYIDKLGMCQFGQLDERTRFKLERVESGQWRVMDYDMEEEYTKPTPMYQAIRWVAGRVLYGV